MISRLATMLGSVALAQAAWAIDIQPGELVPRKAGTNIVQVAYFDTEREGIYQGGERQPGSASLDADQFQVRYVRYLAVNETPLLFYAQFPIGDVKPGGLLESRGGDAGAGDPVFLLAAWPYANRETNSYLVVGAYFSPSTGSYDSHNLFNMGENRNRMALQIAWQGPLYGQLEWMAAIDRIWYGTNTAFYPGNARLEQKPFDTVQLGLNHPLTPTLGIALSLIHSWGAETDTLGVPPSMKVDRYLLNATWLIPEWKSKVLMQYGEDIHTENGLKETRRVIVRYSWAF